MAIRSRKSEDSGAEPATQQLGLFGAVAVATTPARDERAMDGASPADALAVVTTEVTIVVASRESGEDARQDRNASAEARPRQPAADRPANAVANLLGSPAPALPTSSRPAPALPPPGAPTATAPAAPRVYGVADLVRAARLTLESRFTDVRVEGEISGLRRTGGGHLYFTLKDDVAALDCVLFAREAGRLRFKPEDGLAVRLRGRLTIFEGRGKFQMSVAEMEPTGAGALAFAFEQLKRRLAAEGLFETARKRPLPFMPRRIGIVTSPHGAVIRDIIRVAHRRFPVPLLLAPAPVQGPGSAAAVVAALGRLATVADVDVIIVARGGGSLEDLWTFNEEVVARAIASCPKPVISAIGHETDFTIADFVADLRAPTPSAAAELAVPLMEDLRQELSVLGQRARRALRARTQALRLRLEQLRRRLGSPRATLDQRRQRVDDLAARLQRAIVRRVTNARQALAQAELKLAGQHPRRRIEAQRALVHQLRQRLETAERRRHDRRRHLLESLRGRLVALSPLAVLERGYSLTRLADGRLVTNVADVAIGARVAVTLRQGTLDATVTGTHVQASGDAPPRLSSDLPEESATAASTESATSPELTASDPREPQ